MMPRASLAESYISNVTDWTTGFASQVRSSRIGFDLLPTLSPLLGMPRIALPG